MLEIKGMLISPVKNGVEEAKKRYADINLGSATGSVILGIDYGKGDGVYGAAPAIEYPNALTSVVTPAKDKKSFIVDPDLEDRFVHMGSAESIFTKRIVDFFFDSKLGFMFVLSDLNYFDPDVEYDKSTNTILNGKVIFTAGSQIGDPLSFSTGDTRLRLHKSLLIDAPVDTKTHLLPFNGTTSSDTVFNSGLQLTDEVYIEGSFPGASQFVSFGPSEDLFSVGVHSFRIGSSAFPKIGFNYCGKHKVKDLCIPLNF